MCNSFALACIAFMSSAAIGTAMTIKPLPKIHVDSLSPQTFDAVHLDKAPVILVGSSNAIATACPAEKLRLSKIEQSCSGWVQGKYVKTHIKAATSKGEAEEWAGLKDGSNEKVDFLHFIEGMGKQPPDKPPRFMFDVPMRNLCPSLLTDIHIPHQFVGIFESQFLWRHFKDDNQKCAEMPFMNMYLAEAGFETDLHIDSANTAFFASMCEGRKKWRILSPQGLVQFHSELAMPNTGRFIEGKWVNAEIKRPFETWTDSSPLNSLMDLIVFEGILEPGEILYIPPGAPHAAVTLDHSIMLASNDQSIQSLDDIGRYCSEDASWFGCGHYQMRLATVQENYVKYTNTLKRDVAMPFAKAFDCETAVKRLARPRLEITPMNFHEEAQKGPMIVMKYDRSCLRCLYILDQLIESRIGKSLRFGVLNCPGGECDNSSNDGYNQLLQNVREELPEFVYVAPRNRSTKIRGTFAGSSFAVVSRYYGPIDLDFLKVWINMKASETIFDLSLAWWWDAIIRGIHIYTGIVVSSLSIVGLSPSSDDVLLLCVMFVIIAVLAAIVSVGIYWEGVTKTSTLGKKKKV